MHIALDGLAGDSARSGDQARPSPAAEGVSFRSRDWWAGPLTNTAHLAWADRTPCAGHCIVGPFEGCCWLWPAAGTLCPERPVRTSISASISSWSEMSSSALTCFCKISQMRISDFEASSANYKREERASAATLGPRGGSSMCHHRKAQSSWAGALISVAIAPQRTANVELVTVSVSLSGPLSAASHSVMGFKALCYSFSVLISLAVREI